MAMISDQDVAVRLLVAAGLGCAVGFERERLLWAAGIRTHMLVAVGSCLLMIVSAYGFQHALLMPHVVLDPSRIAAQVVSGIGFLGAGSILLRGQVVKGLTTAASVWAVAAIGLASGGGLFFAAAASTVIILVILAGLKPLEEAYRTRAQGARLEITAERDRLNLSALHKVLGLRAGQIRRVISRSDETTGEERLSVTLARVSPQKLDRIIAELPGVSGVTSATARRPTTRGGANTDHLDR
jgi:putative Mg2+ transporter-C (MgtC) family protein